MALVSNAGGEDTAAGLDASVRVARDLDLVGLRVAATIPRQDPMEAVRAVDPTVSETGKPVSELDGEVIGATVYESAWPVVEALHDGADVVVTVGSAIRPSTWRHWLSRFRWDRDEWDLLARGMAVGHLMECGGQLTGGYYAAPPYKVVPGLASLGLPYAVVDPDGNAEYRKVPVRAERSRPGRSRSSFSTKSGTRLATFTPTLSSTSPEPRSRTSATIG